MTLLISILTMRHCTVAPLSAAVTLCMVILDGFGPDEVSVDVILTAFGLEFRLCPKLSTTPVTPGRATSVQTSSPDSDVSQEKVKLSSEQASSLRRRVTERYSKQMLVQYFGICGSHTIYALYTETSECSMSIECIQIRVH